MNNHITPNFIGVGGHKCASTWLSECMRSHPEIFMTNPKETGFFINHKDKGFEWYLRHYDKAVGYKARGEFTSYYLYDSNACYDIYNYLGNVKIIAIIREPVARAISQIKHGIRAEIITYRPMIKRTHLQKMIKDYPAIVNRSLYAEGLSRYHERFGDSNFLVFNQEDFRSKPDCCLKKLWEFLGVDIDHIPSITKKEVSPGIVPRFQSIENLRRRLYQKARDTPGIIPFVRKTRLSEVYRFLNRGREVALTNDAKKYIQDQCYKDWEKSMSLCWDPLKDL